MIADAGVLARAAAFTAPIIAVIVAASIGPWSTSEPARNPVRGLVVPPPRYTTASIGVLTVIELLEALTPTNDCSCAAAADALPVVEMPSTWTDSVPLLLASMCRLPQEVIGADCANRCQPRMTAGRLRLGPRQA